MELRSVSEVSTALANVSVRDVKASSDVNHCRGEAKFGPLKYNISVPEASHTIRQFPSSMSGKREVAFHIILKFQMDLPLFAFSASDDISLRDHDQLCRAVLPTTCSSYRKRKHIVTTKAAKSH